jgi:hypothetical protein
MPRREPGYRVSDPAELRIVLGVDVVGWLNAA